MYLSRRILKFCLVKLPKYLFSFFFTLAVNFLFSAVVAYLLYEVVVTNFEILSMCSIVYPYFIISSIGIVIIHIGYIVDGIFEIVEFNYKRKYSLDDEEL